MSWRALRIYSDNNVHFWAPTRMWVFPKFVAAFKGAPENLALRSPRWNSTPPLREKRCGRTPARW